MLNIVSFFDGISGIRADYCDDYASECGPGLLWCPDTGQELCLQGRCALAGACGQPGLVQTHQGCMHCDATASAVDEAKVEAVAAHLSCEQDSDCVLVKADTACGLGCDVAVNNADSFLEALSDISADYCGEYPLACTPDPTACNPWGAAGCFAGQCSPLL